jgi:nucleotide-binding universal stress UspA family protein
MHEPAHPPKRILVATDLSAHSDRALDRGIQLSQQWGARLIVLHVMEQDAPASDPAGKAGKLPVGSVDLADVARRMLRYDIGACTGDASVVVKEGDPVETVMDVVAAEGCDLVVIGTARSEGFSQPLLGKVAEHIVRKCPASVLVVKSRPRGAYGHVLVGTDLTPESREALTASLAFFPQASIMLMRAFEGPYQFLLSEEGTRDIASSEVASLQRFLGQSELSKEDRGRVHISVENGPASTMLGQYAWKKGADLTVVGSFNRGLVFHVVLGGNTKRIVDAVPNDVLVVRATRQVRT